MTEPASSAAGAAAAWKLGLFGKLAALLLSGVVGAAIIAAVDPPKTRLMLFAQAATAGIVSIIFTPIAVRVLDHYVAWFNAQTASGVEMLEVVLPVGFLIGALSWGFVAAAAKLREIIRERGAAALANHVIGK